jgi:hypothetical protein
MKTFYERLPNSASFLLFEGLVAGTEFVSLLCHRVQVLLMAGTYCPDGQSDMNGRRTGPLRTPVDVALMHC